jgi:hypothetical protein
LMTNLRTVSEICSCSGVNFMGIFRANEGFE